jgi:hypothetical protein
MAITTRQTSLLVQQDWTKIYQTFKEADFQSYDFETLRKTMIDYLRTYYPEDFNDFIESSEYIALIDLIAFLGQSLAFRTDLNARENFIDTAERRDSILKLARLISYNPKRNLPASGYLKIDSVSTTESVTDSNGTDLSNLLIGWNDTTNDNWQEQFNTVLNAGLINSQVIGRPGNSQMINNIQTDEYTVSIIPGVIPTYRFNATVEGNDTTFEIVSGTSVNQTYIYEDEPRPRGKFNILYRNDNLGNSSNNTGYFVYFKQGSLNTMDFNLTESLPNRTVNVNFENINNSDTWLYGVNTNGGASTPWTNVPAVSGVNIAYTQTTARNLYQINTRSNDQIDLVFGDGAFANIPQGRFRFFYRQSNGLTYKITPDEIQSISVPISYVSRTGRAETLTLRVSLYYTVANATAREGIEEIRAKAPQQYYTQNRMITGEDYNILPYTAFSTVLKTKAVNRTSSGVSRFLDVLDVTGKYSSTNIFAQDGYLYKDESIKEVSFSYQTTNEAYKALYNIVRPLVGTKSMQHFFYAYATRFTMSGVTWNRATLLTNASQGGLVNTSNVAQQVGTGAGGNLQYVNEGALIRFIAPTGQYFNGQGVIKTGTPTYEGDRQYIYACVDYIDSTRKVLTLNQQVPTGAILDQIIPAFANDLVNSVIQAMLAQVQVYKNFGLRYSTGRKADGTAELNGPGWYLINARDLGGDTFSFSHAGDTSGTGLDSSWLIKLVYDGTQYIVSYRGLDYTFESLIETKFYFDERVKVFDSKTGQTLNDQIKVLQINNAPDSSQPIGQDLTWFVYKNIVEADGFENNNRILVTFPDSNSDGIPDNPDLFELIVDSTVNPIQKLVFFKTYTGEDSFLRYVAVDKSTIVTDYSTQNEILLNHSSYLTGQLFYASAEQKFYQLGVTTAGAYIATELTNYIAKTGRQGLKFQYRHNSPNQRRIDPSPNNIMDLYILTKQYATDYMAWIRDTSNTLTEPTAPTNEELKVEFSALENYKTLSDTIIYNSSRFKPIFGSKANNALRAKFKVVKNPNIIISDNDVKTSVISAINNYFDINNWDFGETFYFSELSAYLHNTLTPNIASVIIVPSDTTVQFGNLYQINAQPDEIIVSAATVNDVEIISAITASQINQSLAGLNTNT